VGHFFTMQHAALLVSLSGPLLSSHLIDALTNCFQVTEDMRLNEPTSFFTMKHGAAKSPGAFPSLPCPPPLLLPSR
jgi:hypothetical protein